ncbi:aminoimidazole riboside kinase [Radiobacillus kanasensis]|uniref:aminoimidazole riboside kinase n=1 Tax=Radiobacillus kanasensis TaxID=2844358 RepID=UPI001E5DC506|nr:aminoimidazole riboside kinase [Radiobacillus kanasensis]UFT99142.1 aminoimidazole riboside kinase [Radiobacillus kanasensis]
MKRGVVSLGEALIDFIPKDARNMEYIKSPGGAPANVAVGLARLQIPSTFIGKVGDDVLGHFLQNTLATYGVNTNHMLFSKEVKTGLVFVTLDESGDRSFDFFVDPRADEFLSANELDEKHMIENKILHIGSISLIDEPVKTASKKAVEIAKQNGVLVSFDPNLRMALWGSENQAKETIQDMLPNADILKVSEEELEFLTGESDVGKGIQALKKYNIPLIFVTLGPNGSVVAVQDQTTKVNAMKVQAVDTTGAGDAFVSGILYCMHECEGALDTITLEKAKQMAEFASVSGGLASSVKGAMTTLPDLKTIQSHLQS